MVDVRWSTASVQNMVTRGIFRICFTLGLTVMQDSKVFLEIARKRQ